MAEGAPAVPEAQLLAVLKASRNEVALPSGPQREKACFTVGRETFRGSLGGRNEPS